MGLETHALNLVRYISRQRPLGQVLTIGRQELDLPAAVLQQYSLDPADRYCENLLGKLGAEVVHSLDVSDYEGATIIRGSALKAQKGEASALRSIDELLAAVASR